MQGGGDELFCFSFPLEKDATSSTEIMQIPPAGSNPFDTKSEDEEEAEGEHLPQVQDEVQDEAEEDEEEAFLDPELADRLPFLKQRSRHAIAVEEKDLDTFDLPPLMADEALRTRECFFSAARTWLSLGLFLNRNHSTRVVTSRNEEESSKALFLLLR